MDFFNVINNNDIIIVETAKHFGFDESIIVKDYYVTMILKWAVNEIPGLVFKGGTSLSKCLKLIDRFSEDIDLTLDVEHSSQSYKRESIRKLIDICSRPPFVLTNEDKIKNHTHGLYNIFIVDYPNVQTDNMIIKNQILVEMVNMLKCYPCICSKVCSYIGEYLLYLGRDDLLEKYNLYPFEIKVQTIERTFVDKIFAVCDYYERKQVLRNSRHIYDLYKIIEKIDLEDPKLKQLIEAVRSDRSRNAKCVSAGSNYDINKALRAIKNSNYYKSDYENVTKRLLTKNLDYETAITVIDKIISANLF